MDQICCNHYGQQHSSILQYNRLDPMCSGRMDGAAIGASYPPGTSNRLISDILHNDSCLLNDVSTGTTVVSPPICEPIISPCFVYSTSLSSPFQAVRTHVLLQIRRNRPFVAHKCATFEKHLQKFNRRACTNSPVLQIFLLDLC